MLATFWSFRGWHKSRKNSHKAQSDLWGIWPFPGVGGRFPQALPLTPLPHPLIHPSLCSTLGEVSKDEDLAHFSFCPVTLTCSRWSFLPQLWANTFPEHLSMAIVIGSSLSKEPFAVTYGKEHKVRVGPWKDSLRNLRNSGLKSYSKSITGPEFHTAGLVGEDSGGRWWPWKMKGSLSFCPWGLDWEVSVRD